MNLKPITRPRALLALENLHHVYEDGTQAIRGVDLEVQRGEFLAVLGANGSGKTTLIKHLNGLLKPSEGRVLLDGKPVARLDDREVFSRIGIVFQDPNDQLFAATVEDDVAFGPFNIGLPQEEVRDRVRRALCLVGMEAFSRKSIHALSHGQKKRVCIAGVLAMAPEIMVLDEPTDGLDPAGAHALMEHLAHLNREEGITMIMATHVVDLVPVFMSRVAIMRGGELFRCGTPPEVFEDPEAVEWAGLHLPIVAELMRQLRDEDGVGMDDIALTVGEARGEILRLLALGEPDRKSLAGRSRAARELVFHLDGSYRAASRRA